MKLTFLGTGSAFTQDNYHTNMLLEINGKNLLIDCGSDARFALNEIGLSYKDIDSVYISHAHADHAGGLEYLAFCSYFDPSCSKIKLFADEQLMTQLWENTMQGGLGSIQNKITKLSDFFVTKPVPKNGTFKFEGFPFRVVQTVHVMNGYTIVPSYGLIWEGDNRKIFLTTDTQFCPNQIQTFYDDVDIVFHDCETSPFKSSVHAHFTELATLDEKTKKKMWLTHYADGDKPDAEEAGFAGYVVKGQVFIL